METWKEFEQNEITHSGAHYLMSIEHLVTARGYARVSDVARHLEVTRGSASLALKLLREKGFIDQDENRFLRLTGEGERIARAVRARRAIVESFFTDVLHIDPTQAQIDTCKIEHLISRESGQRLLVLMQFLLSGDRDTRRVLEKFWSYAEPEETQ